MIVKTVEEIKGTEAEVSTPNWISRRLLLKKDYMGFSFHETIVYAGTATPMQYLNHLEAVYCLEGERAKWKPQTMEKFILLKQEPSMHLINMINTFCGREHRCVWPVYLIPHVKARKFMMKMASILLKKRQKVNFDICLALINYISLGKTRAKDLILVLNNDRVNNAYLVDKGSSIGIFVPPGFIAS